MNLGLKLISSSKKSWIKSPRGSGAFSLIEVIIAAAIVAIIMAALFTGVTATFNLEGVTRENLRATQIIVSRMEGRLPSSITRRSTPIPRPALGGRPLGGPLPFESLHR